MNQIHRTQHVPPAIVSSEVGAGALLFPPLPAGFYDGKVLSAAMKAPLFPADLHSNMFTSGCRFIDMMISCRFPEAYWLVKGGFSCFSIAGGRS